MWIFFYIIGINLRKVMITLIQVKFADLALQVRRELEAYCVDVSYVRQFLIDFFQKDIFFESEVTIEQIFIRLTAFRLWDYQNYSPLIVLTDEFLPNNEMTKRLISNYRDSLMGFFFVSQLIDFIILVELDSLDFDDHEHCELSTFKELMKRNSHLIKVRLQFKRRLNDQSIDYVYKLWHTLREEYDLPPLTVLIQKIVSG